MTQCSSGQCVFLRCDVWQAEAVSRAMEGRGRGLGCSVLIGTKADEKCQVGRGFKCAGVEGVIVLAKLLKEALNRNAKFKMWFYNQACEMSSG